jgi:hypothetical protein
MSAAFSGPRTLRLFWNQSLKYPYRRPAGSIASWKRLVFYRGRPRAAGRPSLSATPGISRAAFSL